MNRKKDRLMGIDGSYTYQDDWIKKIDMITGKKVRGKPSTPRPEPPPTISQKAKILIELIVSPTKVARNPQAYNDLCKYINELEEGF